MACIGLNAYHSAFGKPASHFHYCNFCQDEPRSHYNFYHNKLLYLTLYWFEAWLTAKLAFVFAIASDKQSSMLWPFAQTHLWAAAATESTTTVV